MICNIFINFADCEVIDGVLVISTNIRVNKIVKQLVSNNYDWNFITDMLIKIVIILHLINVYTFTSYK